MWPGYRFALVLTHLASPNSDCTTEQLPSPRDTRYFLGTRYPQEARKRTGGEENSSAHSPCVTRSTAYRTSYILPETPHKATTRRRRPRQIHTLLPGGKRGDQLASMFLPIPSVQADQGHFLKAACLEQGTACLLSFRLRFSL